MNQIEALQNALNNLGLSDEYTLHINYGADKNKKEENRKRYLIVGNGINRVSPPMTYTECNHFIFGINFHKTN